MQSKSVVGRHLEVGWLVSTVVLVLGVAWVVFRLVDPPLVHVTDLGRDLIGARAAIEGLSPYQRLGDIADSVPVIDVPEYAESYWVVHTPFSIAMARLLWATAGESAERVARAVSIAATLLLMFYHPVASRLSWRVRVLLAGALAMSFGASIDILWLQGASLLALALAGSLTLLELGRRGLALAVLGVCVAWRPWCAPLALLMPRSETPMRDGTWVAATSVLVTVASLPAIGGFPSLMDWTQTALPINTTENLVFEWNATLLARQIGVTASLALLALITAVVAIQKRSPNVKTPTAAALGTLALAPLVWPPHWVGLYPALLHGRSERSAIVLACALILLANPLVGLSSVLWRVMSVVVILLLAGWLVWSGRMEPSVSELATDVRGEGPGCGRR